MKVYTIKFKKNSKKYAYKTTNYKLVKKLKRKVDTYFIGIYDTSWFN